MSTTSPGLQYLSKTERFYTTKRGKAIYEELKLGSEKFHPFDTHAEIFMLGLSVGLLTQEKVDKDKFDELLFLTQTYVTHDELGVYPLIVKSMHPDLDESGVARMIERYAEAGLRLLYQEFKNTQKIDFQALLKLASTK